MAELAPGLQQSAVDRFAGSAFQKDATSVLELLNPETSPLSGLIPGQGDFREKLQKRLQSSGLSSAASAAGAVRGEQQDITRRFQASQPILSSLRALETRLRSTAADLPVTSGIEAFGRGFFS